MVIITEKIKAYIEVCRDLGWEVYEDKSEGNIEIRKDTPSGDEVCISIKVSDFVEDLFEQYEEFDAQEYVTMLWDLKEIPNPWPGYKKESEVRIEELYEEADWVESVFRELVHVIIEMEAEFNE